MAAITLAYFGSVTDVTRIPVEQAEVPATLMKLNDWLQVKYPGLAVIHYRFAVNRHLVTGDYPLAAGDEVALLPPFAGG